MTSGEYIKELTIGREIFFEGDVQFSSNTFDESDAAVTHYQRGNTATCVLGSVRQLLLYLTQLVHIIARYLSEIP